MKRRHFLQSAATLAAAAALGARPVVAADEPKRTTFVLVHGAWHNSGHWVKIVDGLSAMGHRVVTLDLPGHGVNAQFPQAFFSTDRSGLSTERSPLADVTLEQATDSVMTVLEQVRGYGNTVLVGHSMAGHMISRAADRKPSLVDRLVYLAAFMPTKLPSFSDYAQLPEGQPEGEGSFVIADPAAVGAYRIDPRSTDPKYLALLQETFYGDVDKATFQAYANSLTPDQPIHFANDSPKVTVARWGRVPRTYIVTDKDKAIPPALQDRFIRDADSFTPKNQTRVIRLGTGHSPFASHPDLLTSVLAKQAL